MPLQEPKPCAFPRRGRIESDLFPTRRNLFLLPLLFATLAVSPILDKRRARVVATGLCWSSGHYCIMFSRTCSRIALSTAALTACVAIAVDSLSTSQRNRYRRTANHVTNKDRHPSTAPSAIVMNPQGNKRCNALLDLTTG